MFYQHQIQDCRKSWENYDLQDKAKLISLRLKEITNNPKISLNMNIAEETNLLKHLISALDTNDFSLNLEKQEYDDIIACIAKMLSDNLSVNFCKKVYIYNHSFITWSTNINNITLFKALRDFSNNCTECFLMVDAIERVTGLEIF